MYGKTMTGKTERREGIRGKAGRKDRKVGLFLQSCPLVKFSAQAGIMQA